MKLSETRKGSEQQFKNLLNKAAKESDKENKDDKPPKQKISNSSKRFKGRKI